MKKTTLLSLAVLTLVGAPLLAAELVAVPGSTIQYPTPIESSIGSKQYKMDITGTAERTKLFFNVYAIASYVQEGAGVTSAADLCNKDVAKQLHLVMERDVTGAQMASAFEEAVRLNYAAPQFNQEIKVLGQYLRGFDVPKGEHIWITNVPGVGLDIIVVGKKGIQIKNPAFSKAIWEIYLGPKNIGASIKTGLVSKLK